MQPQSLLAAGAATVLVALYIYLNARHKPDCPSCLDGKRYPRGGSVDTEIEGRLLCGNCGRDVV